MWQKPFIIIFLFYLFALLQNSFFVHFSFFGLIPNLIFIFFFSLVFFLKKERGYQVIYYSALAGLLLDMYSGTFIGPAILILMVLGFMLKKMQSSLKSMDDNYPFGYFSSLFLLFYAGFRVLIMLYLQFIDPLHISFILNFNFLIEIIYNSVIASVFFYVLKRWQKYIA